MRCCPNCFADEFLRKQIRAESQGLSSCSFCGSQDIETIETEALLDRFNPVLDLYTVDQQGVDLATLLQRDWGTFGAPAGNATLDLLCAITSDQELREGKYRCKIEQDENKLEQWLAFSEELKHENRFFPALIPDQEHLRNLFELLTLPLLRIPERLYRARINATNKTFSADEMGMPPREIVANGRANPRGIPYLYVASNTRTAISEVRPFIGETVTVMELQVADQMALVDLRNPRQTVSPFELLEDDLTAIYRDMPYLTLLGDELSKPIVRRDAELEYLPSQYLCEFVKHIGFEGILYRSSLADGDNVALFKDDKLDRVSLGVYQIEEIGIKYVQLP